MADVRNHSGNGLAGDGFFNSPEQFDHGFRPAENNGPGVDPEPRQPAGVGDADILAVARELHEEDCRAATGLHGVRSRESEAEGGAGVAPCMGEDLVDKPLGEIEEFPRIDCGLVCPGKAGVLFDAFNPGPKILQHPLFRKARHRALPVGND